MNKEQPKNKKFQEVYDVSDYEVYTDEGWRDISKACKTVPYKIWKVILKDGKYLECADDHIVFSSEGKELFVKDLKIGQCIKTVDEDVEVVSLEETELEEPMYDLQVSGNRYYTNGILSHNTTVISAYALWFTLFHSDKIVGIVSNKERSAKMILRRIKKMYESVPVWLKPGVKGYAETTTFFDNGSQLIISATSEDAFRGETLNLLLSDELAFVGKNKADAFWSSNQPTIAASKTSKIIVVSCVVGNTYVYSDRGPSKIENFFNDKEKEGPHISSSNYNILGKNKLNEGNIVVNSGITNTKIIKTTSSFLECANDHKLWSFCEKKDDYDWHKSSELEIGDYVPIKYGMNLWGDNDVINFKSSKRKDKRWLPLQVNKITEDWAYLFGLYLSKGNADKYRLNIACGDDISNIFNKLKLKYSCSDGMHYIISRLSLIELLKFVGFDISKKSPQKEIPQRLLEMSSKNISALLRGIFDGDGFSRKDKGTIGIGLSSKEMITQIRMLLLNFGILTDYYEVLTPPTKIIKVSSMQYLLQCNPRDSQKFYDIIGFNLQRKQDNRKVLGNNIGKDKKEVIPNSKNFLMKFESKVKPGNKYGIIRDFEETLGNTIHNRGPKGSLSKIIMLRIKKILPLMKDIPKEVINFFDNNVSKDIKWEKITKIDNGNDRVYDFSLPHDEKNKWCHSVIYNGYIGHQTPNGMFNLFHRLYIEAEKGRSPFKHLKADWRKFPGRDEEWKKEQIKVLGKQKFLQEHEIQFLGSTHTVIDSDVLERILLSWEEPSYIDLENKFLIYEKPMEGCLYAMGCDVAKGTGEHYSAIQVLRIESLKPIKMKQVAAFIDNTIDVYKFADTINRISYYYNNAYIVVENNAEGAAVVSRLWWDHENENLVNTGSKAVNLGIRATKTTKPKAVLLMKKLIEDGSLELVDKETLEELTTFVEEGNKFFGKDRADDAVSALYWAVYLLEMNILDESFEFIKEKEEDGWGILSDINIEEEDWSWLYNITD